MTTTAFRSPILRPLARIMALVIGIQPCLASAQVVADPRAPQNQQPQVGQAANGIPLVNIQAPSAAGVSRNTYQQFDVNRQGVILNNAQKNASTQLGGWVEGNANLKKGSARIILNEVNSMSPSQLRGYMEIAGSRAQLVIANPSGIVCDGCGFINANRATLTTGTPIFQDGNLTGYRVQGGRINIEGQGLDARGTDYTDLITRAVSINSGLWAEHLNIITGTNQVSTDLSQITPIAGNGNDPKPAFALDVASLGGMYAGKIYLIGTEAGLGVINAGHIGAAVGDVTITVDGRLESKGSLNSTGNTQITARQGIQNDGTLYAQGNLNLNTSGNITNTKIIAAAGNTSLSASDNIQGTSGSLIAAGLQPDNTLTASGTLALNAGQTIDLKDSDLVGHTQRLNAAQLQLANSRIQGNSLYLTATGNADLQGSKINLSGLLNTQVSSLLDTRSAQVAASQFDLKAGTLNNQGGTLLGRGDAMALQVNTLLNDGGNITGAGHLTLQAERTSNTQDGLILSLGDLILTGNSLNNQAGQIQSRGNTRLLFQQTLDNTRGQILAQGNLDLQAQALLNLQTKAGDTGIQGQDISLKAQSLDNTQGSLIATRALSIQTPSLNNNLGTLSARQILELQGDSTTGLALNNAKGFLMAGEHLGLIASLLSGSGQIRSQGDIDLALLGDWDNQNDITAHQNLSLTVEGTLTNRSTLEAGQNLTLNASQLANNAAGEINAGNTLINITGLLTNRGLIDGQYTRINAGTLNNLAAGRLYGDHLAIRALTLTNETRNNKSPVIAARDRLDLGVGTLYNREHALIFSAGDMHIGGDLDEAGHSTQSANALYNNSATIEALGDLSLNVGHTENTNEHFSTKQVVVSRQTITEYQLPNSPNRWDASQVQKVKDSGESTYSLRTPEGNSKNGKFYEYVYTRTVVEEQIATSDPGQILAGGNLFLTGQSLLNDKSRIIAGSNLIGTLDSLVNTTLSGQRTITDQGTATQYYYKHQGGGKKRKQGKRKSDYLPAATVQDIDLTPTLYQALANPNGSGYTPDAQQGNTPISDPAAGKVIHLTNDSLVATLTPDITLGNNSLYRLNPDTAGQYLIETDPRFANYRQWLSSDYMIQALNLDLGLHKRLGDGFYEQRLIREQIGQLTGRRFLEGYVDDETQYRALLDAGTTFAQAYSLIPGIALTDAQMAQLTSDIVWLVEQDVTLPDGSTTRALVPQVYVRLQPGDLTPSGALLAADQLRLELTGDLTNSGTLAGRNLLELNAANLKNLGGTFRGMNISLEADQDIDNIGGSIAATQHLIMSAGRDINIQSTTNTQQNQQNSRTNISRVAGLYVTGDSGLLMVSAERNVNLMGALVINDGQPGISETPTGTLISAGQNITLGTVDTRNQENVTWDSKNYHRETLTQEIGTTLNTVGNLTLLAGQDITARGAHAYSAEGTLSLGAGRDITLASSQDTVSLQDGFHFSRSGGFSTKSTTSRDTLNQTLAQGSVFSGEVLTLESGRNLTLSGSQALSTYGTTLTAAQDITIEAAYETTQESHYLQEKKSGFFSSGGAGVTYGKQEQRVDGQGNSTHAVGSTVGSIEGDVMLIAGRHYTQTGSHIIAPEGDIGIAADQILIQEARETNAYQQKTQFKQSGLTVSISNPVITAIQTGEHMKQAAKNTSNDPRQAAMGLLSTGLSAYSAYNALNPGGSNLVQQAGGINLSISVGSSKSESKSWQTANTATSSSLVAGGNLTLLATNENRDGNITIRGSDLSAGNNMTLMADRDIQLLAAANTYEQHSKNSSSSNSLGISVGVNASGGVGLSLTASANKGKGNADGKGTYWSNSHLLAGDTLTLISGGDLTLRGAVAKGDTLLASVGGNLLIESLQDTDDYKSQQKSSGFSLSVPVLSGGLPSGSISKGQTDIDSTYKSVTEQSALKAGDGGFDVDVGGNTTLIGGAILSTQEAIDQDNNYFNTGGELSLIDLKNKAEYEGKGYGVNIGAVPSDKGAFTPGGSSAGIGHESGESESTTHAAISGIAGKEEARTGDKESGIEKIFDADKVQKSLDAQIEITRSFGQQASKLVGDYAEAQIKKAIALKNEAGKTQDEALAAQLNAQAKELEDQWGANGTLRLAAHTLIGGLTGNVSGAAGAAIGTLTAAEVSQMLAQEGIKGELNSALTALASTAAGALAGGTEGAGAAFNEVTNNYLKHAEIIKYQQLEICAKEGNRACQEERFNLEKRSVERDILLERCSGLNTPECNQARQEVRMAYAEILLVGAQVMRETGKTPNARVYTQEANYTKEQAETTLPEWGYISGTGEGGWNFVAGILGGIYKMGDVLVSDTGSPHDKDVADAFIGFGQSLKTLFQQSPKETVQNTLAAGREAEALRMETMAYAVLNGDSELLGKMNGKEWAGLLVPLAGAKAGEVLLTRLTTVGTTGVLVGGAQYVESAVIQANTTIRLSESVTLANGKVLPKGSIVTVSDDAMKVVLPDGTSSISSYSKAMTPPKALPAPEVTSGGTANAATGAKLNAQLVGQEIAGGHAFEKHVLQQGEFAGLIKTRQQFAEHIESVINNPTAMKQLSNGRTAFWDDATRTVVIRNPKAVDGGTAFQPASGRAYFDNLR